MHVHKKVRYFWPPKMSKNPKKYMKMTILSKNDMSNFKIFGPSARKIFPKIWAS